MIKPIKISFESSKSVEVEKGYVVDSFLSKEHNRGYSMVRMHLDGRHPFMKNTKSNRTYYILDGSGKFVFDEETFCVESGEMVSIPANTRYAFKGKFDALLADCPAFDSQYDIVYDEQWDEDDTLITYNKIASKYDEIYGNDYSDTPFIDKFLDQIKGKAILDIGCGTGVLSAYIANKGFMVDAIDFSKEMLKIAKKRIKNVQFIEGDMRNINALKKYDGIMLAYSLFHISKKEVIEVLPKYYDLLKKDGCMLIILQEGENEGYIKESLDDGFNKFVNFYSFDEIEKVLLDSGFSIIVKEKKMDKNMHALPNDKLVIICKKMEYI